MIDIGAHIGEGKQFIRLYDVKIILIFKYQGQYSLIAAKTGHRVIAVEPYSDSHYVLHKAAVLSNVQDKITLLTKAISYKKGDFKLLSHPSEDISRHSLIFDQIENHSSNSDDKHLVETITLDDIIQYLPHLNN